MEIVLILVAGFLFGMATRGIVKRAMTHCAVWQCRRHVERYAQSCGFTRHGEKSTADELIRTIQWHTNRLLQRAHLLAFKVESYISRADPLLQDPSKLLVELLLGGKDAEARDATKKIFAETKKAVRVHVSDEHIPVHVRQQIEEWLRDVEWWSTLVWNLLPSLSAEQEAHKKT